jgi:hypothetical protein
MSHGFDESCQARQIRLGTSGTNDKGLSPYVQSTRSIVCTDDNWVPPSGAAITASIHSKMRARPLHTARDAARCETFMQLNNERADRWRHTTSTSLHSKTRRCHYATSAYDVALGYLSLSVPVPTCRHAAPDSGWSGHAQPGRILSKFTSTCSLLHSNMYLLYLHVFGRRCRDQCLIGAGDCTSPSPIFTVYHRESRTTRHVLHTTPTLAV